MKQPITLLLFTATIFFCPTMKKESDQQIFVLSADLIFKASGTSTLHDWQLISKQAEGKLGIFIESNKITGISFLTVTLPVISLKSGKSAMDESAHKTLKHIEFPTINFEFTEFVSSTTQTVKIKGQLNIAGNSQEITLEITYKLFDGIIRLSGSTSVTFSQFNIDPPTTAFGTVKAGDKIKIFFDTYFKLEK